MWGACVPGDEAARTAHSMRSFLSATCSLVRPLPVARVEVLPEGGLRLLLPQVGNEPSFQRFTREDARRVLQQFHADLAELKRRKRWVASAGPAVASLQDSEEDLLLKEYIARYGEPNSRCRMPSSRARWSWRCGVHPTTCRRAFARVLRNSSAILLSWPESPYRSWSTLLHGQHPSRCLQKPSRQV